MKKFFILLLSLIATVCLFVGCNESNSSSKLSTSQSVLDSGVSLQDDAERCLTYLSTSNGYVVYNCDESAVNVIIPEKLKGENVVGIYKSAFEYCDSLTSVTIGDSVTSIGDSAFHYCTSLTSVTIPDRITSIGSYAFSGCSSLTSVTIGDSVTSIGNYAFSGCDSLTSVTFKNTSGWWYSYSSTATSGTDIDVTNAETNAVNLSKSSYNSGGYSYCYWKRNA